MVVNDLKVGRVLDRDVLQLAGRLDGSIMCPQRISNACPSCEWFSPRLEGEGGWPKWNGILPEGFDATTDGGPAAIQMSRVGYLGGAGGETKNGEQGGGGPTTP